MSSTGRPPQEVADDNDGSTYTDSWSRKSFGGGHRRSMQGSISSNGDASSSSMSSSTKKRLPGIAQLDLFSDPSDPHREQFASFDDRRADPFYADHRRVANPSTKLLPSIGRATWAPRSQAASADSFYSTLITDPACDAPSTPSFRYLGGASRDGDLPHPFASRASPRHASVLPSSSRDQHEGSLPEENRHAHRASVMGYDALPKDDKETGAPDVDCKRRASVANRIPSVLAPERPTREPPTWIHNELKRRSEHDEAQRRLNDAYAGGRSWSASRSSSCASLAPREEMDQRYSSFRSAERTADGPSPFPTSVENHSQKESGHCYARSENKSSVERRTHLYSESRYGMDTAQTGPIDRLADQRMLHASSFSGLPSFARSEAALSATSTSEGRQPAYRKRGKLPKAVTDLLKTWLLEHATHPYPTDDEKRRLCSLTGLMMSQVSNWFINARRRIRLPNSTGGFAVGASASASMPMQASQRICADRVYDAASQNGPASSGQPYVSCQQYPYEPMDHSHRSSQDGPYRFGHASGSRHSS